MFDKIAHRYDLANFLLSAGVDLYWRKKLLQYLPAPLDGASKLNILDIATGTAEMPLILAGQQKQVQRVIGIDLSSKMLAKGKEKVMRMGMTDKIELRLGDGVAIPFSDASFDVATLCFGIRNFDRPQAALSSIQRILKPGGRALILEFSTPANRFIRFVYNLYLRHILPFVGKLISRHPYAYRYLNETVESFPCGADFASLLKNAGLSSVRWKRFTFGIATLYIGDKAA